MLGEVKQKARGYILAKLMFDSGGGGTYATEKFIEEICYIHLNSLEPMGAHVWKRMAESKKRDFSMYCNFFIVL